MTDTKSFQVQVVGPPTFSLSLEDITSAPAYSSVGGGLVDGTQFMVAVPQTGVLEIDCRTSGPQLQMRVRQGQPVASSPPTYDYSGPCGNDVVGVVLDGVVNPLAQQGVYYVEVFNPNPGGIGSADTTYLVNGGFGVIGVTHVPPCHPQLPPIAWANAYGHLNNATEGGLYVASEFYQLTDGFSVAVDHNTGTPAHMSAMRFQHTGFAWESVLGIAGGSTGSARVMRQTADGGYIVGGRADIAFDTLGLIVRLANNGAVQWGRTFSRGNLVMETMDIVAENDGFMLLLRTQPAGGTATIPYLVKVDPGGNLTGVSKEIGPAGVDFIVVSQLKLAADGTYVLVGTYYQSIGGDNYWTYAWVGQFDRNANRLWHRRYGRPGGANESGTSVAQLRNGDFVLAGMAHPGQGGYGLWLARIDVNHDLLWQEWFTESVNGPSPTSYRSSVDATLSGRSVIVAANYTAGNGQLDGWLAEVREDGTVAWQRRYGHDTGNDEFRMGVAHRCGGVAVTGNTTSPGWHAGAVDAWTLLTAPGGAGLGSIAHDTDRAPVATAFVADAPMLPAPFPVAPGNVLLNVNQSNGMPIENPTQ